MGLAIGGCIGIGPVDFGVVEKEFHALSGGGAGARGELPGEVGGGGVSKRRAGVVLKDDGSVDACCKFDEVMDVAAAIEDAARTTPLQ